MLENTGVFRHSLPLRKGLPLSQAGVRNLKNTVWKTPFGTVRQNDRGTDRTFPRDKRDTSMGWLRVSRRIS